MHAFCCFTWEEVLAMILFSFFFFLKILFFMLQLYGQGTSPAFLHRLFPKRKHWREASAILVRWGACTEAKRQHPHQPQPVYPVAVWRNIQNCHTAPEQFFSPLKLWEYSIHPQHSTCFKVLFLWHDYSFIIIIIYTIYTIYNLCIVTILLNLESVQRAKAE